MNALSWIVLALVIAGAAGALAWILVRRKNGGCSGGCAGCPYAGSCSKPKKP
ncbi:MAG: FeoB-associated Cys-rich membrane protein [Eubacteriales bacterium]|nr:FeoB-associated Cys-rich membrane protein [Eubacteriales bacterium]